MNWLQKPWTRDLGGPNLGPVIGAGAVGLGAFVLYIFARSTPISLHGADIAAPAWATVSALVLISELTKRLPQLFLGACFLAIVAWFINAFSSLGAPSIWIILIGAVWTVDLFCIFNAAWGEGVLQRCRRFAAWFNRERERKPGLNAIVANFLPYLGAAAAYLALVYELLARKAIG